MRFAWYWHFYLALLFCGAHASSVGSRETIKSFDATVQVNVDGTLDVIEKLTVRATGESIRHGIVREFPTTYKDQLGTWYIVDFNVSSVTLNGEPVSHKIVSVRNGKKVYIGEEHYLLPPGTYTYQIHYATNRQLGFFEGHDELYWNVTGQGWRLPIDTVTARIILPQAVTADQLKFTAYTGYQDEKGKAFTAKQESGNEVVFKTTRQLQPREGLTIVVGFPKGIVQEPTWWQKISWFLNDNKGVFIFIAGALAILFLLWWVYRRNRRRAGEEPVIPLFYPPDDLTPGAVCYLYKKGYDSLVFASDVVNMAVHGLIEIDYQKKGFLTGSYTLKQKQLPTDSSPYKQLFFKLFSHGDITLSEKYVFTIERATDLLRNKYSKQLSKLFHFDITLFVMGAIGIGCAFAIGLTANPPIWAGVWLLIFGPLLFVGSLICNSYTRQGFAVKRAIAGFKLFLETTEIERLKLIGTPPTKTPELYEKYLPYAIALGVEQQWTAQFAQVFKQFEVEHKRPYSPIWYVGPGYSPTSFSSQISSGLSSAIASSSFRPGSGSGFGGGSGGGGAGRGGGGGGGGGW